MGRSGILLKYIQVLRQTGLSKQCRPRCGAANAASDQVLHILQLIQQILDTSTGSKMNLCSMVYVILHVLSLWICQACVGVVLMI